MADVGTLTAHLELDRRGIQRSVAGFKNDMRGLNRAGTNAFQGMGRAVTGLAGQLAALGGALGGALLVRSVVQTGAAFQKEMSAVGGIVRATTDQFDFLTAAARKAGETTEFSATQAAGGLKFLAQAGFSATEAARALPGVIDLSTASGVELARSADIASNALSAMQLEVGELGRVNDTFVGTITRSNTNMEQMAEAFKYSAPLAKGFGVSIESLAAQIGLLGNAGIQGSSAGTQLRFAMLKAKDVAADFGLEASDLASVLGALNKRGVGTNATMKLFGARGGQAALVLRHLLPELEAFTTTLEKAGGETATLAKKMRDNVATEFKNVTSAIEAVKISLFDVFSADLKTKLAEFAQYIRDNRGAVELFAKQVKLMSEQVALGFDIIALSASHLAAQIETKFLEAFSSIDEFTRKTIASGAAIGALLRGDFASVGENLSELKSEPTVFDFFAANAEANTIRIKAEIDGIGEQLRLLALEYNQLQSTPGVGAGPGGNKGEVFGPGNTEGLSERAAYYSRLFEQQKKTGESAEKVNTDLEVQAELYKVLGEAGSEAAAGLEAAFREIKLRELADDVDRFAEAGASAADIVEFMRLRVAEINKEAATLGGKTDAPEAGLQDLGDGLDEFAGIVDSVAGRTETAFSRVIRVMTSFISFLERFGNLNVPGGGGGGGEFGWLGKILSFIPGVPGGASGAASSGGRTADPYSSTANVVSAVAAASSSGAAAGMTAASLGGLAPLGATPVAVEGTAAVAIESVSSTVAASGGFGGFGAAFGATLSVVGPAVAALQLFRSFDRGVPRGQAEAEGRFTAGFGTVPEGVEAMTALATRMDSTGRSMAQLIDNGESWWASGGTWGNPVYQGPTTARVNLYGYEVDIAGPAILHDEIQQAANNREFETAARHVGGATAITNVYTQDKRSFMGFEDSVERRAASERTRRRRGS